jgi:hypothetical protein
MLLSGYVVEGEELLVSDPATYVRTKPRRKLEKFIKFCHREVYRERGRWLELAQDRA